MNLLNEMKSNKTFRSITIFIGIFSLFFPFLETKANEYKKGFYTSASIGLGKYSGMLQTHTENNVQSDYPHDAGFNYEANIGYDFGKKYRFDLSYNNNSSKIESGRHAFISSLMLNGYIDFPIEDSKWEPFIGLGIGTTNVNGTNTCFQGGVDDCVDDVLTIGVSGGVNYALSKTIDLTSKLTYYKFDDITMIDSGRTINANDTFNVVANMGLKFKF